jgi:hypothetical protein
MNWSRGEEARLNHALGQTNNMKLNCKARVAVLRTRPEFSKIVDKVDGCTPRQPCNQEDCYHCGVPGQSYRLMGNRAVEYDEPPHLDDLVTPAKARNYRNRGGQILEDVFLHFNPNEVYCLTVHLVIVPLHAKVEDLVNAVRRGKDRLRKDLSRYCPDAVIRGFIDDKVFRVRNVPFGVFPDRQWAVGLHPDDLVADLHLHALVHIPGLDKSGIDAQFRGLGYSGDSQVDVRGLQDSGSGNGPLQGGIRGWGQYGSKRFIELNFESDNIDVFLAVRSYRTRLTRKQTHFGFGCGPYIRRGQTWTCEAPSTDEEIWKEIEDDCRSRGVDRSDYHL